MDQQPVPPLTPQDISGRKLAAGMCAVFVGSLGIHKFIMGMNTPALVMLLVTLLTCGIGGIVMQIVGIVEGVMYLSKTDHEFHQVYIIGRREWF